MMFTERLVRPPDFCVHQIYLYMFYFLESQYRVQHSRFLSDGSTQLLEVPTITLMFMTALSKTTNLKQVEITVESQESMQSDTQDYNREN